MSRKNHIYYHDKQELHGYLSDNHDATTLRPAVLVIHDWSGRNEFACEKADLIANLGYIGFAVDMYGQGQTGQTNEEKQQLMQPLAQDRAFLLNRIQAALQAVLALPHVDPKRIAVMGFCFGGLCALDLARSGADIKGVVSFHGILNKPTGLREHTIKSKVLVLHGYDDPMVKPDQVQAFCQEMTEAKVDWQVHMYGCTKHAFTNPLAHDLSLGLIYNDVAAERAIQSMRNFLEDIFV